MTDPQFLSATLMPWRDRSLIIVLDAVVNERKRQDAKWDTQNHPQLVWHAIISEEVGELAQELLRTAEYSRPVDYSLVRAELVQIAASAVAAIESLDRNEHVGLSETEVR